MAKALKPKKTFKQKIQEEMPDFANAVDASSVDQLEKRLSDIAKAAEVNEQKKEDDKDLAAAKAEVQELNSVYSEPRKVLRKQTKYIVATIREKGGKVE